MANPFQPDLRLCPHNSAPVDPQRYDRFDELQPLDPHLAEETESTTRHLAQIGRDAVDQAVEKQQ